MSFYRYESYSDSGVPRLGLVPQHWPIISTKRITKLIYGDALSQNAKDGDGEVPVFGSNGPIKRHTIANTEAPAIFIGRKGSCGVLNWTEVPSFGIDTVYFIDKRHTASNLRWLFWALHVLGLEGMSQDTGVPGLAREAAYETRLPLPSVTEQAVIATFLDRETAKIDALVEEQTRLIELLKEKRQAVISHAVTKGLNPNAPMKDSGVEWLGEVPAHWDIRQLGHLARPGTAVTYGIVQAGPDVEGGIPYIRTSDMAGDCLPSEGYLRTSPEIDASYSRSKVKAGDLVIAIRATIGKPLIVPPHLDGANLTQGTAKLSPNERMSAKYIQLYLRTSGAEQEFQRLGKGATFKEITLEMLRKFRIACPPLSEQELIVKLLKARTQRLDHLIDETETASALLKERRRALISAAVTGKIDVRGLVPVEAEAA